MILGLTIAALQVDGGRLKRQYLGMAANKHIMNVLVYHVFQVRQQSAGEGGDVYGSLRNLPTGQHAPPATSRNTVLYFQQQFEQKEMSAIQA